MLSNAQSVTVHQFDFTGNTRFSIADLRLVVKTYLGRPLTPEELEQARVALTQHYVNAGYINSGAVLPDQPIDSSNPAGSDIRFYIVEGRISDVRVTYLKGNAPTDKHILRKEYLTSRLNFAGGKPLDIVRLKNELELLRQDPNIESVNAELRPGATPGKADLDLAVRESNPFQLGLQFSNRRPPSVGSTALDVLASDRDLTGNGDLLALRYDALYGELNDMRWGEARDYSIDYSLPISPSDTTLAFDFSRTDALVVSDPFSNLNIDSDVKSYALTLRQPIWRRPTADVPATPHGWAMPAVDFGMFVTGTIRDDDTSLLGEPFDVQSGVESGHSREVAIRFGQDMTTRTADDALSARSTFSFGVPVLSATQSTSHQQADSQFVSWLGQAQYIRRAFHMPVAFDSTTGDDRTGAGDAQVVMRVAGQLTSSPLLDVEKFVIGGVETVRGYAENTVVDDEGVVASAELRLPIVPGRPGDFDRLILVPFFDTGYARDLLGGGATVANHGESLNSVGIGVVFNPNHHVNLQVYYGYALTNRDDKHPDPQYDGIHFSLSVFAF
jgi:hemolysin activation/secretion protein